jgi:hypothetical protein
LEDKTEGKDYRPKYFGKIINWEKSKIDKNEYYTINEFFFNISE